MNAVNLYTRKVSGIDYRVWLSMLVTWLACLGLAGYRQINASSAGATPCAAEMDITINGKRANDDVFRYLNQLNTFRINTAPGTNVQWDFGDGSKTEEGRVASHTFRRESAFTVKVTVNGRCEYLRNILVRTAPSSVGVVPEFEIVADSTKTNAGGRLRFSCAPNFRVDTYEWRLLNTNQVQTTPIAIFTFPNAGMHRIQLMLNNDPTKVQTVEIEVVDPFSNQFPPAGLPSGGGSGNPEVPVLFNPGEAQPGQSSPGIKKPEQNPGGNAGGNTPEPPKPDPAKAIEIDPETFKGLMQSVLDHEKEVTDLYPYLDYKESTFVQRNGSDKQVKLTVFCREYDKRKIEKVEFQRDNKNGIQLLKVKLKRRWPFGARD